MRLDDELGEIRDIFDLLERTSSLYGIDLLKKMNLVNGCSRHLGLHKSCFGRVNIIEQLNRMNPQQVLSDRYLAKAEIRAARNRRRV